MRSEALTVVQIALKNGATVTFNSRARVEEQVAEIQRITAGNFARILDATAYGYDIMVQALETSSTAPIKYLTTVDDWQVFTTGPAIKEALYYCTNRQTGPCTRHPPQSRSTAPS